MSDILNKAEAVIKQGNAHKEDIDYGMLGYEAAVLLLAYCRELEERLLKLQP
jgi:hypothetical protein